MGDANLTDGSTGREATGIGDTPLLGIRHPTSKTGSVTLCAAAQRIGFSPEEIKRLRRLYEKPESMEELGKKCCTQVEEDGD